MALPARAEAASSVAKRSDDSSHDARDPRFYPDSHTPFGYNRWTGAGGQYSLRSAPSYHPQVSFYTLHAGENDEVHCSTLQGRDDCANGALFEHGPNVKAPLYLGAGSRALKLDFDFSDRSPWNAMGGDTDGIGHYKVKNNTGQIPYEMFNTDCDGLACKGSYVGGPVKLDGLPTATAQQVTPLSGTR